MSNAPTLGYLLFRHGVRYVCKERPHRDAGSYERDRFGMFAWYDNDCGPSVSERSDLERQKAADEIVDFVWVRYSPTWKDNRDYYVILSVDPDALEPGETARDLLAYLINEVKNKCDGSDCWHAQERLTHMLERRKARQG